MTSERKTKTPGNTKIQKEEIKQMLFRTKKKKEEQEKKELLYRENIRVGCPVDTKENVIRAAGKMLVESGYVDASYVDAMIEREKTFSTYMGGGLALPHGVLEAKKAVKCSGISVMTFPEGIDWDGNEAHMVIAVAGVGDEHLEILAQVAEKMVDEESAAQLMNGDVDTIYKILTGKEN